MSLGVSVSKGCFVYKNGFESYSRKSKKKGLYKSVFEQQFSHDLWYETYKDSWQRVEKQIEVLNTSTYNKILQDLVIYVKECYNSYSVLHDEIIPCATLLTGINQPDHIVQFTALRYQLLAEVTTHVAIIYSQDANSVKQMIENMILQFINDETEDTDCDDFTESPENFANKSHKVKKSQCNMTMLNAWFREIYGSKSGTKILSPSKKLKISTARNHLVVIIPDFESFNCEVLQDFILILSGYTSLLPFVLVFGVATAVSALHKSFPYHVSSRLFVQVFQSHSSTLYLNQVLENIFLNENCPFHLSGKAFKLLIDVFLFYDFSVTGLIQSIKYCMMEHYYASKMKALCCPRELIHTAISQLSDKDLESIKHLPSFRPYVESKCTSTRISLLTKNDYLRIDLAKAIENLHNYLYDFHISLKVLLSIVASLPNAPLGKQIRELYISCMSSNITESSEYKQCVLLIGFQSKDEFLYAIDKSIVLLDGILKIDIITDDTSMNEHVSSKEPNNSILKDSVMKNMLSVRETLKYYRDKLKNASLEYKNIVNVDDSHGITETLSRQNLKEQLLKASTKENPMSEFDIAREKLLKYLSVKVFNTFLKPPNTQPFHELFFFSDVYKVKRHIVGTPRASIHTALNNPSAYLQCKCCELCSQEMILPSLPDLSIAFKLHLECGKLINLYDWLQAFLTIVDPIESNENDDEERREIVPEIQARFTRAVSELQFLGFVKTSKRKTDHVSRLTW